MADRRKAVRLRIEGVVQGVNFRAWTCARAERLGLAGWVRNEADGSVTAFLAGPDSAVDAMIGLLREGPPAAKVAGVTAEAAAAQDIPKGFRILR